MAAILKNRNNSGYSLIESCIILFFITGGLIKIIMIMNLHFYSLWIHFWNHEMLICIKKNYLQEPCIYRFKKRTEQVIKVLKIKKITILKKKNFLESQVQWGIKKYNFTKHQRLYK